MAAKRNPFHRIRLVYRRSSTLLKCVVLATILLSTAALVILRTSIQAEKSQQAQLQEQAAQGHAFISCCFCNQLQIRQLETTQIYYCIVLEVRSPKSGHPQSESVACLSPSSWEPQAFLSL